MARRINTALFAICAAAVGLWILALVGGVITGAGPLIDLAFGPLLAAMPVAAIGGMVCVPWRGRARGSGGGWVVSGGGESTPPGRARPPRDGHR
jgi:hypothetical protein